MFTTGVIISVLKEVFKSIISFFWQYKWAIILGAIIGLLYLRGNHYEDKYRNETVAHLNAVLQHRQDINNIRIANEQALRIAQEESAANYKELVEKTQGIQEKYNERNKDINATITKLNSSNNSLLEQIRTYSSDSYSDSSEPVRNTPYAERIQKLSESLESCIGRKQFYAEDAARLNNSVVTLQEWGNMVIENSRTLTESSKQNTSKGDKSE